MLALRSGGTGDVTGSYKLWSWDKSTPDSSSPVCYAGLVFMCSDQGIGTCLDPKTGEVYWQQRLAQGPYHASLVAGDGKVYFLAIDGTCTVMAAEKTAKVLAENKLPGTFYATPAISDGTIYLRAYETLFAVKGE
jgi:outer membrane protein assembly factor BamB